MNALNFESEYDLKSCSNINCEDYTTQGECLGKLGIFFGGILEVGIHVYGCFRPRRL